MRKFSLSSICHALASRYSRAFLLTFIAIAGFGGHNAAWSQSYLQTPKVQRSLSYNSQMLNFYTAKLKQALYVIYNGYVDTVNLDKLAQTAVVKMIQELDPHSSYISAEEVKEMEEPLLGNFEGIGIEYAIIKDTLTVQSVIADGPSERAGLKAGDKIDSVNGEIISGTSLTTARVLKYLRGNKGTRVRLGIIRRGLGKREVTVVRDKIPLNTVDCSYEIAPGVLFVRVSRFGANTYSELMGAVNNFYKKDGPDGSANAGAKLKGLILDLRGNGGGYLHAALTIVNEFLERGQLILYTEGRAVQTTSDVADGSGTLKNVPLVVLIDESSASASEIVAGAVQDWDRGTIIGRRSFGKGLVQQEFPLQDGSRLRLTVARYHTPSGRVIQSPYTDGKADEYYNNVIKRYLSDERFNKDSIKINDSLKFKTRRLGRTVYGGGGIIPDVFVPLDTSYYSVSYAKALNAGNLTEFATEYVDNNRGSLESLYGAAKSPSEKEASYALFVKNFNPDGYVERFLEYTSGKGEPITPEDLAISGEDLKNRLKGLIIRYYYGLDYYLRYYNLTSEEVLKAVRILTGSSAENPV